MKSGSGTIPLPRAPSPLLVSDTLIGIAIDLSEAGLHEVAGRVVALAHAVLDRPPPAAPG